MATEAINITTVPTNLHTQDLSQLDIEKLTPSTPEVISRQATINIGTIGHVAHGKSTIVKALSGVQTVRFKNELEKNITIKLERLEFDVNGEIIMPKEFTSLKRKWEEDADEKVERKPIKVSSYAAKKGFFAKEYVVEKILDYSHQYGKHNFFVKWEGWNEDCNTWEPFEHLQHCQQRIEEYFLQVFNADVINKMCKSLSVSQNLTNKSLESIIPSQGFNALKNKLQLQLELLNLNSKPIISAHIQKIKRGKENLLLYFLHTEREKQVKRLTEWQNSVNAISCEQASIHVENEVDLEVLPDNFTYVNDYVPMEGVDIPQNPPIGCSCESCTPKESECCGRNYSLRFTYRDKGRLNLSKGQPIYECNKMCACDSSCRNRVIQSGRKIPLCIFRTNNGRGWGVKSTRKIFVGEFVCEYVGEVISHDEAEKRGEIYDAQGRTYLFDLDFNMSNNPYTVDAAKYGNISHFINHSCEPNLGVWAAWINCLDPNLPKLALFAIREIQKDEEITFDYMAGSNDKGKSKGTTDGVPKSPTKSRLDLPDQDQNVNRPLCKCDAKACRRYLF